jgi:mannose-6-phosphate isomerase-like protein (cupin superfamily)
MLNRRTHFDRKPIENIPKKWGWERVIANSPLYCGKLLFIHKGMHSSYHYHKKKDETFYIQQGTARVQIGWSDNINNTTAVVLREGDKFHVPVGMRHRIHAEEDLYMFEFSTEHFDDDSIRIDDA